MKGWEDVAVVVVAVVLAADFANVDVALVIVIVIVVVDFAAAVAVDFAIAALVTVIFNAFAVVDATFLAVVAAAAPATDGTTINNRSYDNNIKNDKVSRNR